LYLCNFLKDFSKKHFFFLITSHRYGNTYSCKLSRKDINMKKVSLLGFILAATAAPHFAAADAVVDGGAAVSQPGCPKAFQGFHLGGNIGYGVGLAKEKFARAADNGTGTFVVERAFSNNLGVDGVDGGIGVGYTHRMCNWALGIAFDANWTGTSGSFKEARVGGSADSVALKARLRNSLQLYGRLGYVIREVAMPFVGLGWDNSQWKQETRLTVAETAAGAGDSFAQTANKSKRFNSFMWKVGVDFLATRHVVVGFEYTGNAAGRKKVSRNFVNPQTGGAERITASLKPQYNKFALTAKIVY
jgi:opacity protein-like surface antigen